jgi:hypothetical protein
MDSVSMKAVRTAALLQVGGPCSEPSADRNPDHGISPSDFLCGEPIFYKIYLDPD